MAAASERRKTGPKPRLAECHPARRHEAHGLCEACYRERRRKTDPKYAAAHREQSKAAMTKVRAKRPGYISKSERDLARNENPQHRLALRLKSRYQLTIERFSRLLENQNNACGICKRTSIRLCVDHDHETGQVRGLLCVGCNTGLGHMRDGALFAAALEYLAGAI